MSAFNIFHFTFQAKQLENKYSNPDISDDENDKNDSDNFDDDGNDSSESSDDDAETTKNIRQAHKNVREEVFEKKMEERSKKLNAKLAKTIVKSSGTNESSQNHHKFRELDEDEMKNDGNGIGGKNSKRKSKKSLEERLEEDSGFTERNDGHQMVFKPKKSRNQMMQEEKEKEHRKEREEVRRSASGLKKDKIKPKFWKGKRII